MDICFGYKACFLGYIFLDIRMDRTVPIEYSVIYNVDVDK